MTDSCFFSLRRRLDSQQILAAVVGAAGVALTAFLFVACGGSAKTSEGPRVPRESRSETLEHEPCSETGRRVEVLDTNNDGRADIRRVLDSSGRDVCRVVDLNHDGKEDLFEYFNPDGTLRRREFCYDDSAAVNAIELYDAGKLSRREYDTTGRHKIDTWDWFDVAAPVDAKSGRPKHPARRERDTTGDGAVDQWWSWEGDKVTIATDHNGDGKPDPDTTIVLGGEDAGAPSSAVPPDAATSDSSAEAEAGSGLPSVPGADGGQS